jgi:hypothetical protein
MKNIIKRLFFGMCIVFVAGGIIFPAIIYWILTGKDILSSTMDKIVFKFFGEDL